MSNSEPPTGPEATPPSPPPPPQAPGQQQQSAPATAVPSPSSSVPLRQLALSSLKPMFSSPGDYHRFSPDPRRHADQEPEGIVVKSPRKGDTAAHETESMEGNISSTNTEVANSPIQKTVSGKGEQAPQASKGSGSTKSAQETANANVGSPCNDLTPTDPSPNDSSLGTLTTKLTNLINDSEDGTLDINKAADTLKVRKRRIYDVTNVLEGIGLIEKKRRNIIQWKRPDTIRPGETNESATRLREGNANLKIEERKLDERIRETKERLRALTQDANNQRFLFVTEDDIKTLPCFQNQDEALIVIKAPQGTALEVPDPEEAADNAGRRYRMMLRSTNGSIHIYLVSKFEVKEEEIQGVETPGPSIPSTSALNDNLVTTTVVKEEGSKGKEIAGMEGQHVLNPPRDIFSGLVKIVPSDAYNAPDYWLVSDYEVTLSDMWQTDPGLESVGFGRLDDHGIAPNPRSPPLSNPTTEPPPSNPTTEPSPSDPATEPPPSAANTPSSDPATEPPPSNPATEPPPSAANTPS